MLGGNVPVAKAGWQGGRQDAAGPVGRLVRDYSIETVPAPAKEIASFGALLPPGTAVYVVWPPGRSLAEVVDTARGLHRLGLRPVPHLAARGIADRDGLEDLLRQITAQAGVDQVLVVAGSAVKPAGEFHCALQILETGLLERFGIRRIGVAGYPEGHPTIPPRDVLAALRKKLAYGRRAGSQIYVVSQVCFDPDRVLAWERGLRATVGPVPVHVGMPGPASPTSLVKYARICGVGASVRFLTRGASSPHKLLLWSPDHFLTRLANTSAADPDCGNEKAHFYGFGGIAKTARWLAALQ